MSNNQRLLAHLLKNGKDKSWEELAREFGLPSGNAARHTWRKNKKKNELPEEYLKKFPILSPPCQNSWGVLEKRAETANSIADLEEKVVSYMEDTKKGEAEVTLKSKDEIRTLEELIQKTNIDTEKWEITKYVQNYWGNIDQPHWQVKAWLGKKEINQADIIKRLLENYNSPYQPIKKSDILLNETFGRPTSVFISLCDFHLDKLDIQRTPIEEKVQLYHQVLDSLLYQAYRNTYIDEIVYVIGNDFMHTDNYQNGTCATTPQDVNAQWYDAYEMGFDLMVKSISKLRQFCNKLHVVHVPSNHARTKEYYLAHALQVYFREDPNIIFDRTSDNTKVYTYGECFIGMHHGDTEFSSLLNYFPSRYYKLWGQCKHKEVALADKHHRKTIKVSLEANEIQGTRMFIAPSLSTTDKWHKDKLYDLAIRAGICRIYDKEKGYKVEFEERI